MSVQPTPAPIDDRERTDIRVRDAHFSAAEVYRELDAQEGMSHE